MHVQTPGACLKLLQRPNACWQSSELVPGHNKTLQTDKAIKTFQAPEPIIGCIQCLGCSSHRGHASWQLLHMRQCRMHAKPPQWTQWAARTRCSRLHTLRLLSLNTINPVDCHVCSRLALLEPLSYVLLAPPQQLPMTSHHSFALSQTQFPLVGTRV